MENVEELNLVNINMKWCNTFQKTRTNEGSLQRLEIMCTFVK